MYELYKNQVISSIMSMQLNLNEDQINKILTSMDKAAQNFSFYEHTDIADFQRGNNGVPKAVYTYLEWKRSEGLAPKSIYEYKIMLEIFFKNCPKEINEIAAEDIKLFLKEYQANHNISNRTLDKYREYVCRFFSWLHDMGYIYKNPGYMCRPIKYEIKQRQALTDYELELFRNACTTARERAIVEVFYSTGCRISELCILKFTDIDWLTGDVHIFGKGSKHRTSFLNARARVALDNYLRVREGNSEYIFVSDREPHGPLGKEAVEKIIRKIAERVDGCNKHITPHVLRHTTATLALKNGMNITDISSLLGHNSIETTMIYAKTSYESVRAAHAKYIT